MSRLGAILDLPSIEHEASLPRAQSKKALAARRDAIKAGPRTDLARQAVKGLDLLIARKREEGMDLLRTVDRSLNSLRFDAIRMLVGAL